MSKDLVSGGDIQSKIKPFTGITFGTLVLYAPNYSFTMLATWAARD
jgi:hypothetical protein